MKAKAITEPRWTRRADERRAKRKTIWIVAVVAFVVVCLSAVWWLPSSITRKLPGINELATKVTGGGITVEPLAGANASVINVKAGGDLQAAINRARAGDVIMLEAGAQFRGTFKLPNKAGAEFITIRSAAPDAQLPRAGERIDPAKYARLLPKISSDTANTPAMQTEAGAHHYRFVCVEFGATVGGEWNIFSIGTAEETRLEQIPHHFEFDRVFMHGDAEAGQRRGIGLNGSDVKIANSYFSDFKRAGDEAQAICGWGTPGNILIENNYLEAAAEAVLFGGAAPKMSIVPTGIVVRGNHFNKPLQWRGTRWVVKNHFELKNARRVVFDGNLLTNVWGMAQDGSAIVLTVRAEGGAAKQATIDDVQITNNIVRGAGGCFQVFGYEGQGGKNLVVRNNLFIDVDAQKWNGRGQFILGGAWDGVTVEHNTILNTGNITTIDGDPVKNFVFRNNIVRHNEYGFTGAGAVGAASFPKYFPGAQVSNNAIIGGSPDSVIGRNAYPTADRELRFVDLDNGDYRLRADSTLKGKATDRTDIGVTDFSHLPLAQARVRQ